jgi:hypothetical protein
MLLRPPKIPSSRPRPGPGFAQGQVFEVSLVPACAGMTAAGVVFFKLKKRFKV